jgi:hypothetical protein
MTIALARYNGALSLFDEHRRSMNQGWVRNIDPSKCTNEELIYASRPLARSNDASRTGIMETHATTRLISLLLVEWPW